MKGLNLTRGTRVETEEDRQNALKVLAATYQHEKGWVLDAETVFPASDLNLPNISWFLASRNGQPVGVLRVFYDPPILSYLNYGLKPVDEDFDIQKFIAESRIAEVGRFAVIPERRSGFAVALSLMRIATREIVTRGYTQLITDVFEKDKHSPLGFHMRIIGFRPVATHETGELRHNGRRITLLLDIKRAYRTMCAGGNMFFRSLTRGWPDAMHRRLAA